MANKEKNQNVDAPVAASAAAEVVASTPSSAIAAVSAGPAPLGPDATNDERIAHAREMLQALAEGSEFEEELYEISANMTPNIKGLEGASGVSIPVIAVRQKTTREDQVPEGVKVGELYTKQGDKFGNMLDFIPIRSTYKRTKFVQGQDKPECVSDDGITGSKYGKCNGCVFARYEEGQKTACSGGWSFQGVLAGFKNAKIYQIDFMKTSAKSGKKLRTLAIPPTLSAIEVQIYTEKETNDRKEDYHVLKVRPTGRKTEGVVRAGADTICDFLQARAGNFTERKAAYQAREALGGGTPAAQLGAGGEPAPTADENPDLGGSI